jgi:hypothetical protein
MHAHGHAGAQIKAGGVGWKVGRVTLKSGVTGLKVGSGPAACVELNETRPPAKVQDLWMALMVRQASGSLAQSIFNNVKSHIGGSTTRAISRRDTLPRSAVRPSAEEAPGRNQNWWRMPK